MIYISIEANSVEEIRKHLLDLLKSATITVAPVATKAPAPADTPAPQHVEAAANPAPVAEPAPAPAVAAEPAAAPKKRGRPAKGPVEPPRTPVEEAHEAEPAPVDRKAELFAQAKDALGSFVMAHPTDGREKAIEILTGLGAQRLTELDEAGLAQFIEKIGA